VARHGAAIAKFAGQLERCTRRGRPTRHREEKKAALKDSETKETIMKRFLLLAALVGGFTLVGFTSTAKANNWGRAGWRGPGRFYGGYGYRPGYRYGYRPYVAPGVVIGGPRFGIGIGTPYAYPPVYGPAYGYPGYGW
jgi:hypothetical protein